MPSLAIEHLCVVRNPNKRMMFLHTVQSNRASGSKQIQEYWYKYDSMNRFLITMGKLSGDRGAANTSIGLGTTGVGISYNSMDHRI